MGAPPLDEQRRRKRLADVQTALVEGKGFGWITARWNVTRPAVTEWCHANVDQDDYAQVAANGVGRGMRPDRPDVLARLEIVAMCRAAGWTDRRISRGIGITPSGLCTWLKLNAPFGIEDALSDFREEDTTPRSAAA